jgi:hypothetical protein
MYKYRSREINILKNLGHQTSAGFGGSKYNNSSYAIINMKL